MLDWIAETTWKSKETMRAVIDSSQGSDADKQYAWWISELMLLGGISGTLLSFYVVPKGAYKLFKMMRNKR